MAQSVLDLILRSRKTGQGAAQAERDLKGVEAQSGRTSQALGRLNKAANLAAAAGLAALSAAAIKFAADSIKLASDMEEVRSKFDVVFGETAPEAAAELEAFADSVGRSRLELFTMAASLQDTFVPMGLTREAAKDLSLELTQLAVDVGSFNNVATGDVARDFQSALVGNTETVRKYGIVITEANTKQAAYRLGIAEAGAALTEQEKLLTRVQQIFEGTADAQGDAARTADSLANTQRRLEANTERLSLALGEALGPTVVDLTAGLADAAEALDLVLHAGDRVQDSLGRQIEQTIASAESYADYRAEIERLADLTNRHIITQQEYNDAIARGGIAAHVAERSIVLLSDAELEAELQALAAASALGELEGAAEGAAPEVGELSAEALEAVTQFSSMAEAIGAAASSVDTNLTGSIGRFLDQMEFFLAGGAELQEAFLAVKDALTEGKISPEEAQKFAEELFVAAQDLEVDMDNITADKAAENIREQLGGSLEDAKQRLDEIDQGLLSLPDRIRIEIEYVITGADPFGVPDFQHGGQFRVRGATSQAVPVAFIAHGRETVTVTPAGGATPAAGVGQIGPIYLTVGEGASANGRQLADELMAEIATRARRASSAGAGFLGS